MRLNWNWLVLIRVLLAGLTGWAARVWTALKTAPIETGDIRCATPASAAAQLGFERAKVRVLRPALRTQRQTCLIDHCRTPELLRSSRVIATHRQLRRNYFSTSESSIAGHWRSKFLSCWRPCLSKALIRCSASGQVSAV